jgi:hypothetical protein
VCHAFEDVVILCKEPGPSGRPGAGARGDGGRTRGTRSAGREAVHTSGDGAEGDGGHHGRAGRSGVARAGSGSDENATARGCRRKAAGREAVPISGEVAAPGGGRGAAERRHRVGPRATGGWLWAMASSARGRALTGATWARSASRVATGRSAGGIVEAAEGGADGFEEGRSRRVEEGHTDPSTRAGCE